MKLVFLSAVILSGFVAFPTIADEPSPTAPAAQPPSDEKISYALGMNLGLQIKHIGADVDIDTIAKAIKDVLDGKPLQLKDSELRPIFMQSQAYEVARKAQKNRTEGDAFLAKNAKESGITVLPDSLQYKIIQAGTGEIPNPTNFITFNFRGTWINGVEFVNKQHVVTPLHACPKGIEEVLKLMSVGTKVRIFVPSDVAYGRHPARSGGFGSTLIYDLEIVSTEPPSPAVMAQYGGGRLGHSPDEDFLPPNGATPGVQVVAAPAPEPRANPQLVLPTPIPDK